MTIKHYYIYIYITSAKTYVDSKSISSAEQQKSYFLLFFLALFN